MVLNTHPPRAPHLHQRKGLTMFHWTRLLTTFAMTLSLACTGCDKGSDGTDAGSSGNEASSSEKTENGHHEKSRPLGKMTIGKTTLEVSGTGEFRANATLHLNIDKTEGPMPAALRVWIGQRSGEGAVKVLATGHDNHYHVDVEVPGTVTNTTMLWVEVQDDSDKRESKGIRMH